MELLCCLCVNMHWSVFSCVSPPPTSGYESICIYVWILRKRDRERERQSDTGREKRHLWISPPGTEASRLVLYQVLWALMLLLLPPLTPTATPSDTSGDRHSQITWIAIVSRSSKRNHLKKTFDAPSASFPALSHRRPLWWASWQRLGPSRPEDIFVSCCLGQFNWEANLLPLLLIHTHTHSVLCNKWCLATKCSKSSSHPDCARFRSNYGCCCSQLWQIAKKILEITDAVLIRGDQGMLLPITNQETKEVSALHSYLVVRDAIIWLRSSQRIQFKTIYKLICKLHT